MKNYLANYLNKYKNQKMVVSVSGGVDSLVLFNLLYELNFDIVMVHFNHQKRDESITEATYLKKLAEKLNVPFEYFTLDIKNNFQGEAHNKRKKHLIDVTKKYKSSVIITAHHLNDLLETILIKIIRGSNLLGYAGMTESYLKDGIYYLKPLLNFPKEKLVSYANEHKIKYFEDYSNYEDDYLRNRIRNILLPSLYKEKEFSFNKVIQYSNNLANTFNFIRNTTKNFLNSKDYFKVDAFYSLDDVIKADVISYLLEKENISFNQNKLRGIIKFILNNKPNGSYSLNDKMNIVKNYYKVKIENKQEKISFKQKLHLNKVNILPNNAKIEFLSDFSLVNGLIINLCYNNNALPLYARTRKDGDTLYFSYGHKKLKDFYIDKKISLQERDSDVVIVDKDNQILAVIGKYVNNNAKLTSKITMKYSGGLANE